MSAAPLAFATFAPGEIPAIEAVDAGPDDCIDLWAFALDTPAPAQAWLDRLSSAERERAARFVRHRDRARFAVAHAVLRAILGRYLGVDPAGVVLASEAHGKPVLAAAHAASRITFNLSHSHGAALVGVHRGGLRLGVDLERAAGTLDVGAMARRFFTPCECEAIAPGQAGDRARFYRHWVAKEAVMKAHGDGMAIPLHDVEILFDGDDAARVRSPDPQRPGGHWRLRLMEGPGPWHAAVAAGGDGWGTRLMTRHAPPAAMTAGP